MQAVCLTAAATDQIAVDRLFKIPFGNRKEDLWKGRGRLLVVQVKHPEWIEVERLNLRTAFLEKPADNTEVTQSFALAKCLFQVLVEKNV